jgi:SAM-dependent methyltransferase
MQTDQFQLHAQIEERHWWFVARRRILRSVIEAVVPPSPGSTIVDVGCGTGANIAALADAYECIGIDTSPEAVQLAARRFPQVKFVCGNAGQMRTTIARADLVLLSDVLEHVPDDFRLLSELLSEATPGAYFLLTVPADPALWSEHDRAFGHYRRYEPERFEALWAELNVRPVFVSYFNARLYPLVKAVRRWNRLRGRSAGEAGTDFAMPSRAANGILTRIFAGERHKLAALAKGDSRRPYPRGVSLMALVQRGPGEIEPRTRPGDIACDVHEPAAHPAGAR